MFRNLQKKYSKYVAGLCLVLLGVLTGNVALTSVGASDVVKRAYEQDSERLKTPETGTRAVTGRRDDYSRNLTRDPGVAYG